jgi:hypothetical protein
MTAFRTPEIPAWIRDLGYPGYHNIFELGLGNRNLYGTETLCGDWGGDLLIVAKDFAPFAEVRALAQDPSIPRDKVYRHNNGDGRYTTGLRTNRRLVDLLNRCGYPATLSGGGNLECGCLYVSACFLLKDSSEPSSSLPDWRHGRRVYDDAGRVIQFVVAHMPRLKAIACLGNDAYDLVQHLQGKSTLGEVRAVKHLHPSRGANARHEVSWTGMVRACGLTGDRP